MRDDYPLPTPWYQGGVSPAMPHLGARLRLVGHKALDAVDEAYQMLNRKIDEYRRR